MKHTELVELEKKVAGAPWEHFPEHGDGTVLAQDTHTPMGRHIVCDAGTAEEGQFIAALRNAAPAYFAVVEKAKAQVANCKGVVNAICEDGMVRSYFDVDKCKWVMVPCQCAALREALAGIGEG